MRAFRYQVLQPDEFRLLRVLSDEGTILEIEHASLDSAPRYIALSYTWGRAPYRKGRSASATYSVSLNGFDFPVQENLHDALTHLGSRVKEKGCLLWVDAICIDQAGSDERSSQVRHMKNIYECAYSVYGWLGVPYDEEETRLAVKLMRKFNLRLRDGLAANNDDVSAASTGLSECDDGISPIPGTECHAAWMGIKEMLSQRYWERAWIYQEATGPAPTYYYCGSHWFDKIHLSAAVYMGHHFSQFTGVDHRLCRSIANSPSYRLSTFRDLEGRFRDGAALLKLLSLARIADCTDHRDKVYALRGLADDLAPNDVTVDYLKSVEQVYGDVARFSLSQPSHALDVFGHLTFPATDSQLMKYTYDGPRIPTWIPDWRDRLTITPFSKKLHGPNSDLAQASDKRAYRAHGPKFTHNAHVEGRTLKLDGYEVDHISMVLPTWAENEHDTTLVKAWAPSNPEELYSPTGQTLDLAFRTTLVADMQIDGRSRGYAVQWDILDRRHDQLSPSEATQKHDMDRPLYNTSFGRRLCWTRNGYMGLVPAASKVDDTVCIFFGGQVLYTLRNAGQGHHQLIGECYIHGLMDGEAFDQPGFQCHDTRTFVLV